MGWLAALPLFYAFFLAHLFGDYPLQSSFMALSKSRAHQQRIREEQGEEAADSWLYCLFAHSAIHSGLVWIISGSFLLALVELVLHALIDWAKSEGRFGLFADQALHALCKVLYTVLLISGALA